MAGFALFARAGDPGRDTVELAFTRKGLQAPRVFQLSGRELLLWPKQVAPNDNYVLDETGVGVFAVGSPSYRSLSFRDGLSRLLRDWQEGTFDGGELTGVFAIFVHDKLDLHLVLDRAGIYPVFVDDDRRILTSSFLAALAHGNGQRGIARNALLEALVTGSISAPDTIAEGISLLEPSDAGGRAKGLVRVHAQAGDLVMPEPASPRDAVATLTGLCRDVVRASIRLVPDGKVGMGLSGGYDSRLLLALALGEGAQIRAHTFLSGVHMPEARLASELARAAGVSLMQVPVRLWATLSDHELAGNVDDALHYYDGRTNQTMGTFNDVHTRKTRLAAMDGAALGFNGLGGELFRNREHLRRGAVPAEEWFRYYVLAPGGATCFVSDGERRSFQRALESKYARLCGRDGFRHFDRQAARAIHRHVWLPYSGGVRLAAENQVSFAAMPFAEGRVTATAMACGDYLGTDGVLEAAMIRAVAPELAPLPSAYGHGFHKVPVRRRVASFCIGAIPTRARNIIGTHRALASVAGWSKLRLDAEALSSARIGFQMMRESRLPIDWDRVTADPAVRDTAVYLANLLGTYRDRLCVQA